MLKTIRSLLENIIQDIDAGNSNINEADSIEIVKVLSEYTRKDKGMSKYSACKYLNISRASFDNYVRSGKLPQGRKQAGFKELSWTKKDLDEFIRRCKKK